MFFKLFSLFALVAVALAGPKPDPQYVYSAAAPAVYPAVGYTGYSAYSPAAVAYSAPVAGPPAVPYAYTGLYYR